jgi:hypothetical protein
MMSFANLSPRTKYFNSGMVSQGSEKPARLVIWEEDWLRLASRCKRKQFIIGFPNSIMLIASKHFNIIPVYQIVLRLYNGFWYTEVLVHTPSLQGGDTRKIISRYCTK